MSDEEPAICLCGKRLQCMECGTDAVIKDGMIWCLKCDCGGVRNYFGHYLG